MVFVVVNLVGSTTSITARFRPVTDNFYVPQLRMSDDVFSARVSVPATPCREWLVRIVNVKILKEKEIRSAIASRAREYLVAKSACANSVERSVLAVLSGDIIYYYVIGYAPRVVRKRQ